MLHYVLIQFLLHVRVSYTVRSGPHSSRENHAICPWAAFSHTGYEKYEESSVTEWSCLLWTPRPTRNPALWKWSAVLGYTTVLRCDEARSLRMKENYILFYSIVNEKKLNGRALFRVWFTGSHQANIQTAHRLKTVSSKLAEVCCDAIVITHQSGSSLFIATHWQTHMHCLTAYSSLCETEKYRSCHKKCKNIKIIKIINNNNNKCVMNVSQFQDVSVFFFQAGFITFCWNLHSLWFFIFTFQPAKDWRGSLHSWWQPSLQGHWTRNPLEKSDWPAVLTQRMLSQQGGTGQNTWPACSTKGCS